MAKGELTSGHESNLLSFFSERDRWKKLWFKLNLNSRISYKELSWNGKQTVQGLTKKNVQDLCLIP